MIKKLLFFFLLFSIFTFSSFCQEVVVFKDDRSMTVKSHSEKDGFVFLKLPEGEIAVPKKQIKEIRKESYTSSPASQTDSNRPPNFLPERPLVTDRRNQNLTLKGSPTKTPKTSPTNYDDDDDDYNDSLDDDDDDNENDVAEVPPEEKVEQKPIRPQMPMKLPTAPGGDGRQRPNNPVLKKR